MGKLFDSFRSFGLPRDSNYHGFRLLWLYCSLFLSASIVYICDETATFDLFDYGVLFCLQMNCQAYLPATILQYWTMGRWALGHLAGAVQVLRCQPNYQHLWLHHLVLRPPVRHDSLRRHHPSHSRCPYLLPHQRYHISRWAHPSLYLVKNVYGNQLRYTMYIGWGQR